MSNESTVGKEYIKIDYGTGDNEYHVPYIQTEWQYPFVWAGHRAYKCPNCGGEFDNWEPVWGSETGAFQCPFCGMKKGEYGKKKEV